MQQEEKTHRERKTCVCERERERERQRDREQNRMDSHPNNQIVLLTTTTKHTIARNKKMKTKPQINQITFLPSISFMVSTHSNQFFAPNSVYVFVIAITAIVGGD
jgi:hypothetical protein